MSVKTASPHPITEAVTGMDIGEQQLLAALDKGLTIDKAAQMMQYNRQY